MELLQVVIGLWLMAVGIVCIAAGVANHVIDVRQEKNDNA